MCEDVMYNTTLNQSLSRRTRYRWNPEHAQLFKTFRKWRNQTFIRQISVGNQSNNIEQSVCVLVHIFQTAADGMLVTTNSILPP